MAAPTELLNTLRDIHAPPPVSWWPPAPGWWLLLALVLIALWVSWWVWRARPWRRQALRELQELELEFGATGDVANCVAQVSVLLRRVTLSVRTPATAAALTGDAWLKYLDQIGRMQQFQTGIGRVLITAPYARAESVDVPLLIELARRWMKSIA
jgi:hypothetical protein